MIKVKMAIKKYFLAIVIPDPVFNEVENLKQEFFEKYGLKGGLRSPAHITLHRPFEWKEEKENILTEKLGDFRFEKSFDIELRDFAFFSPRVIYVNVIQNEILLRLYNELKRFAQTELKLLNEVNDLRGFHPHVTIANRDLKPALFHELQKEFAVRKFHAQFKGEDFVLLKLEKTWQELKRFRFRP